LLSELRAINTKRRRVLILGGVAESRLLAGRIAQDDRYDGVISLAGRTSEPLTQPLPTRIGGFGGVEGLKQYLEYERINVVVDATHPFAARMSENARLACAALATPLLRFTRPPWRREDGDLWTEVADNAAAAAALGAAPRRVFLTVGRQSLAEFRAFPQHDYLIRTIEPPQEHDLPPRCAIVYARGPFNVASEIALMQERRIDIVVTKNSGGAATYAKIEAARHLGITVVMIAPPPVGDVALAHDVDAAMDFLTSVAT
jgi:precorrin-6A/cobalt-precorrin-6A reductase